MTEVFGLHTAVCVLAEEEGKEEFDAGWYNLQWTKYMCACTHMHTHTHTHTHTLDIREEHSVRDDTSGVGSMELKSFMEE